MYVYVYMLLCMAVHTICAICLVVVKGYIVMYIFNYSLLYCDTQCLSFGSLFFTHLGGIKVKM